MVQAEQMKVCMLKSLLLYASSSFKSHIILRGCGDRGSPAANNTVRRLLPGRGLSLRGASAGRVLPLFPGGLGGGGASSSLGPRVCPRWEGEPGRPGGSPAGAQARAIL